MPHNVLAVAGLLGQQQLQQSQAEHYSWALSQFPILRLKAYRCVGRDGYVRRLSATGIDPEPT